MDWNGAWGLLSLSLFPSFSLCFSIFLWLSTYLPTDLSVYLSICLSVYLSLPCNELRMLRRHRAVRKDKHAGRVPSEKTDTFAVQRISDAYTPSCRQKRQTRWRATNYGCCCAIAPSEKTNTKKPDRKRHTKGGGQNLVKQCAFIVWCKFSACLRRLQQASRCASKKNVAPCLFYSPPTQPSIGCNSDSKIRTRDSNTSVEPLPAAPHIYLSIYLSVCLSVCLSIYPSIYLSIYLSSHLFYLSIYLSSHLFYLSIYLSIYLAIYLSIYLSISLSLSLFHLSICLAVYLSTCLSVVQRHSV